MLKQADNSYACIAESETRFTLGEVCIKTVVFVVLAINHLSDVVGLTVACFLDKRWAIKGPWTTGGTRKLIRISPQRLQGFLSLFVLYLYGVNLLLNANLQARLMTIWFLAYIFEN